MGSLNNLSDDELMAQLNAAPSVESMSDDELLAALGQGEPQTLELIGADASIAGPQEPRASQADIDSGPINPVIAEAASGVNRAVLETADFFTTGPANAVLDLAGSDKRIPTFRETGEQFGVGSKGFMKPGTARTVVQKGSELIPAVAGMASGAAKEATTRIAKNLTDPNQVAKVGANLRAGSAKTVGKKITEQGKIVSDKAANAARDQGFSDESIASIKSASSKTRALMRRMTNVVEQRLKFPGKSVETGARPADVLGKSMQQRISVVSKANRDAGRKLDAIVKSPKFNNAQVDASNAVNRFVGELSDIGVDIADDLTPVLEGSDVEDIARAKTIFTTLIKRIKNFNGNARQAHRLKRYIDTQVNYNKQLDGLPGNVDRIVKQLRHDLDTALDNTFDEYKVVNEVFAETRGVMDAFSKAAGSKLDLAAPNADKAIGTISRRLMSNVQSRVQLVNSIDGLDDVAAKYGADVSDNINALAHYADTLDEVFKPVAKTSLGGEFAKTAAVEGRGGVTRQLIDTAFDKVAGRNPEAALDAIKSVLKP